MLSVWSFWRAVWIRNINQLIKITMKLKSGITVDTEKYYKLLEWKDTNMEKFKFFCDEYRLKNYSINSMNTETYYALLQFSNLD